MDTKVACLLLIILGALTVQGAVSGNKRMNPLYAKSYGICNPKFSGEICVEENTECPYGYQKCDKYCPYGNKCCCLHRLQQ
ncbi:small cysteine-rich protein 6-like [Orbicella faveolata]|uniref:small cysteine-rich protein 6-like n=1 Tax=Orbicella faveolata TaxID=48498 RepID=UPI0009E5C6A2|nr:small cysteine-rich protein 6-like [Orbicella faveolata]